MTASDPVLPGDPRWERVRSALTWLEAADRRAFALKAIEATAPPAGDRVDVAVRTDYLCFHTDVSFPAHPLVGQHYPFRLRLVPVDQAVPVCGIGGVSPEISRATRNRRPQGPMTVAVCVTSENLLVEGARWAKRRSPSPAKGPRLQ